MGLGSHAALDAIRHDDNGGDDPRSADLRACAADVAIAVVGIAALGLLGGWRSRAMVGAIAGALPDLELALPWNRCTVGQARLLFPSHAAERLHSCISPFRFSLRLQGLLAALLWTLALTGGAVGRRG